MSFRFQVQSTPVHACRVPGTPVIQKKSRVFRGFMRVGNGVVAGGRQLRGVLLRLVNARDASAMRGLTSPADAAAIPLGSVYPRGGSSDHRQAIGLGILRLSSESEPAPTPSTHLENARKNLRLNLLSSQAYHNRIESPVLSELNEADNQSRKCTVPTAKDYKRARLPLSSITELPRASAKMNEIDQVRRILGGSETVRCVKQCMSVEDSQSTQVIANELNAMRRIRCIQGLIWLEVMENRGKDKYILLKWMGDVPLMTRIHNDNVYDLEFTTKQMARLLYGIHCMHQCGVIHRQVSPRNIMTGGADGNFTLFNLNSCVVTDKGAMIDGDIPLWVADKSLGPKGDPKRRARSPYYDDYVALGHIWHEMRTHHLPKDVGTGRHKLKEQLLQTDEMLFIRRLLSTDLDYRFNSVEEMKKHAVFKNIDWQSFDS
ncbi:hypothetical protein AN958_05765 [Leucoagaricus sp. SymC.cos]|nr:hypothetical protein AN958_05765 [Leucoagaricus sp. SymC.cos]